MVPPGRHRTCAGASEVVAEGPGHARHGGLLDATGFADQLAISWFDLLT